MEDKIPCNLSQDSQYDFCIISKKDIIEYEQNIYRAYINLKENWITNHYNITGNRRMRPYNIEEKDLVNYAVKKQGKIIAGITMHTNPSNTFICEQMGFNIHKNSLTCEGLTVFVNEEHKSNVMNILINLSGFLINDLIKKGFKLFWGTTPGRFKNLHAMIFDAEIAEVKNIKVNNKIIEKRALIKRTIQ